MTKEMDECIGEPPACSPGPTLRLVEDRDGRLVYAPAEPTWICGHYHYRHPTREGAIALWREAALVREAMARDLLRIVESADRYGEDSLDPGALRDSDAVLAEIRRVLAGQG